MTTLFLPFPPSVNGMFAGKSRRYKSDSYKAWLEAAKADLDLARFTDGFKWKNHTGMVDIILMFKAPDNRIRDVDNLIKPCCDFLVTHQIIAGDDSRFVRTIHAGWWNNVMKQAGCFVVIEDVEVAK